MWGSCGAGSQMDSSDTRAPCGSWWSDYYGSYIYNYSNGPQPDIPGTSLSHFLRYLQDGPVKVRRDGHVRKLLRVVGTMVSVGCILMALSGCGSAATKNVSRGSATHSDYAVHLTASSELGRPQSARLVRLCQGAEQGIETTVLLFANNGPAFEPAAFQAYRSAESRLLQEAAQMRRLSLSRNKGVHALLTEIMNESQAMASVDHPTRAMVFYRAQVAMIRTLHARRDTAAELGVTGCAGVPRGAYIRTTLPKAPPS